MTQRKPIAGRGRAEELGPTWGVVCPLRGRRKGECVTSADLLPIPAVGLCLHQPADNRSPQSTPYSAKYWETLVRSHSPSAVSYSLRNAALVPEPRRPVRSRLCARAV